MSTETFDVYDTTLRDGAQQEGMNLSGADKMAIAPLLDELGVQYIEGGWPGAIPKDTEFFARAAKELDFRNAELTAFGATRKPLVRAYDDPQVRALLDSGAPVLTLVAKSDIRHVERALRTTAAENLAMITDTVAFLTGEGRKVLLDATHLVRGYRLAADYADLDRKTGYAAGAAVGDTWDTYGGRRAPAPRGLPWCGGGSRPGGPGPRTSAGGSASIGSSVRLKVTKPASRAIRSTSPKRSGWRGASTSKEPGLAALTLAKAPSTAVSSPGSVLPATITVRFGETRKKRSTRSRGRPWPGVPGNSSESNFRLPVTVMCPAAAPRSTSRRADSSLWTQDRSMSPSTRPMNGRINR